MAEQEKEKQKGEEKGWGGGKQRFATWTEDGGGRRTWCAGVPGKTAIPRDEEVPERVDVLRESH